MLIFANQLQIVIQVRAFGLYAGLTLPLAIVSHLAAEAIALHESVVSITTNPVHAYLGVIAISCLGIIGFGVVRARGDLRRLCGLLANDLPFKGKGLYFGIMSAAVQFGFAGMTLLGEGSLHPASVAVAVVAVALASLAVSAVLTSIRSRFEDFDESAFARRSVLALRVSARPVFVTSQPYFAYVHARGSRPPPLW